MLNKDLFLDIYKLAEARRPKAEMDAENKAKVQLKELKTLKMMISIISGWSKAVANKIGMIEPSIRTNLEPIIAKTEKSKILLDGILVKIEEADTKFSFPAADFVSDLRKAFEAESIKGKREGLDIFNHYHALHTAAGNDAQAERRAVKKMTIDFDDLELDKIQSEFKTSGKGFETHLDDLFTEFGLESVKNTIDAVLIPKNKIDESAVQAIKSGWKKLKNRMVIWTSKLNTKLDTYINTLEKMDSILDQMKEAKAAE